MRASVMRVLLVLGMLATSPLLLAQSKDVIIVGGALTEIVYALGAESRIAATDTTSIFPAVASETPKVGYQRSLNAEGVLSLKPKLLLAASEAGPPSVLAQIRGAGVDVVQFSQEYTSEAVRQRIRTIASKLGRETQGKALEASFAGDWARARALVAGLPAKPRVLFVLAHVGPAAQVSGADTAADAMIQFAGGVNAMSGFSGYRPLTAEGVVNARPDVILVTDQGFEAQGGEAGLLAKPGLALTPAGQAKRIVRLDALYMLSFGPRLPQAVEDLARRIRAGG